MLLSINIDHIATLRNARGEQEPEPIVAAQICERAGADGIVVHLREDRRHIRDADVYLLRDILKTKLDLEMSANEEIIKIALDVKPDLVTLVPEKRLELTTEGGLDVFAQKDNLKKVIDRFHEKNISVSLFVDPIEKQIIAAKEICADIIEIHTGEFANAKNNNEQIFHLKNISEMAKFASSINLHVNAGHGLNYKNVTSIAQISEIQESSIGHAIISRAVWVGLEKAVKEMLELVKS